MKTINGAKIRAARLQRAKTFLAELEQELPVREQELAAGGSCIELKRENYLYCLYNIEWCQKVIATNGAYLCD